MDAQTLKRPVLFLLAAVLVAGCAPLRGTPLTPLAPSSGGPPSAAPNSGAPVPADGAPGGTVVAAGGAGQPAPAPGVPQMQPPAGTVPVPPAGVGPTMPPPGTTPAPAVPAPNGPLAAPRPLPSTPGWPGATDLPQPPGAAAPVLVAPAPVPGGKFADPHVRDYPTVTGSRLNLAPYEMSTERVVELTLHLERLLAQNRDLTARIKELETNGVGREQALTEATREIEAVAADAAKTRAALQAQVVTLQGKVKQLEEEDVIFLKAVVEALGRLVPPEKKP